MLQSPWLPNEEANPALGHDAARLMETPEMRERLCGVSLPAWILHGEDDPRPMSSGQRVAELLPHATFVALAACGHFPWAEQPQTFRRHIRRFIASL
jgi:pimeloyl-ACP methyl ester carboxylesterase